MCAYDYLQITKSPTLDSMLRLVWLYGSKALPGNEFGVCGRWLIRGKSTVCSYHISVATKRSLVIIFQEILWKQQLLIFSVIVVFINYLLYVTLLDIIYNTLNSCILRWNYAHYLISKIPAGIHSDLSVNKFRLKTISFHISEVI